MKLTICPHCGGKLRSESIGWICYKCQGFIDMQGVFHEHKEKPFMPPQTNADRIRAMSDEELAVGIKKIFIGKTPWCDHHCKLGDNSCSACLCEWLKQPADEVK